MQYIIEGKKVLLWPKKVRICLIISPTQPPWQWRLIAIVCVCVCRGIKKGIKSAYRYVSWAEIFGQKPGGWKKSKKSAPPSLPPPSWPPPSPVSGCLLDMDLIWPFDNQSDGQTGREARRWGRGGVVTILKLPPKTVWGEYSREGERERDKGLLSLANNRHGSILLTD